MSQKFVPLFWCTVTFDQNFIFTWNFWIIKMFICLLSTCIQNCSNWHALFFLLHSAAVAAWSGIQRVDLKMIHFELFYHLGASTTPKQYLFSLDSWKNNILGIHPKKIIIRAPFHNKAFVLLYKFETSCALLGRLSRGFFAISGASNNFKHSLFMTIHGLGLLTMRELAR